LITPLGNWYNNATSQHHWAYTKYYEDIIHRTDKSTDYYQQNHGQLFNYKTYTKQNQRAIVLPAYTTPMIPIYIGDTSIRCGEPNDMTNTPTITPIYQHIPITINNVIPTIFKPNDIIDIASDGSLKRDHATFGVTISINQILVLEMQGSLPSQIHVTSLTSEAYGCYYAIKKLY
jgi:hypothetical protein